MRGDGHVVHAGEGMIRSGRCENIEADVTDMVAAQVLDQRRLTNEGLRAVLIRITPGSCARPAQAPKNRALPRSGPNAARLCRFREQFVERHKRCVGEGRAAATLP